MIHSAYSGASKHWDVVVFNSCYFFSGVVYLQSNGTNFAKITDILFVISNSLNDNRRQVNGCKICWFEDGWLVKRCFPTTVWTRHNAVFIR